MLSRRNCFIILSVLAVTSSNTWAAPNTTTNREADESKKSDTDNKLTEKEITDGWILLFDGETKFGWAAEDAKNEADWVASEGVLTCSTKAGFNHIKHKADFKDFHLSLDFWVIEKGNSGIFFRGATDGKRFVGPKISGYEAQIDDRDKRGLLFQTGGLYNVAPASKLIAGEGTWRHYDIIAEGDHIITKINGEVMVDKTLTLFSHGHIGLQHHNPGSIIKFKNIKLKPLGLKSIFNGKDLTGWKPASKSNPKELQQEWTVKDGLLHVEVPKKPGVLTKGGQGQLETTTNYKNFVLQLDIRTNGKFFNSGVFYRSMPNQVWVGYESQIRNQWMGDDRTKPIDFGTGGIYNLVKTRKVVSNDKEFFKKTIVAAGRYTGVWVNGYQVSDFTDTRPENANARNGYCANAGAIALQSHDPTTNLDFKNIMVAELP